MWRWRNIFKIEAWLRNTVYSTSIDFLRWAFLSAAKMYFAAVPVTAENVLMNLLNSLHCHQVLAYGRMLGLCKIRVGSTADLLYLKWDNSSCQMVLYKSN